LETDKRELIPDVGVELVKQAKTPATPSFSTAEERASAS